MQIQLENSPAESFSADALAVLCFEAENGKAEAPAVASQVTHDPPVAAQSGWLSEIRSSGEFTGKSCELSLLYRPEGIAAKRLVVAGGGKRDKFSPLEARKAAGALVRALKGRGVRKLAVLAREPYAAEEIEALIEGAILGAWEPDAYKTDPKKNDNQIEIFTILTPGGEKLDALREACERARVIAESQNLTRSLVNEPPNKLNPGALAEAARTMAAEVGLRCEVLDRGQMAKLGMGALLGVAQGSVNPPFLIVLKYRPPMLSGTAPSGTDHLALIGKGVTFDTGGISIKPADGMEKMKYDMAGAAAVIGAMRAISHVKPPIPVTGYIPTVENMLGANAQRPGDIVTSLSGKTIEVLNTDAEGRLILADAITYASRNGATHMVDAATLTGAIGIALGHYNMGAFTNDQPFLERVLAAVRAAGEKAWQLPLEEEYKDYLKSAFADLPNIGGRYGGSITAAWFLREFADPAPWVHLDIASTAWLDEAKPWMAKGPSGVAMRSFVKLAAGWARG
jgi:leucyl aminopeptidase